MLKMSEMFVQVIVVNTVKSLKTSFSIQISNLKKEKGFFCTKLKLP